MAHVSFAPVVRRFLVLSLLAGGPAAGAAAQTKPPSDLAAASLEDLLNVVVTTATRTPEAARDAPARVQVVTADQIRRRGYRSLLELLADIPSIKVDLRADPDFPSELTIDGTRGAARVIVLLDGVRISSPTSEPLPILANYPVHAAHQVEVVFGPASAVYGADAFSSVVNIVSRDVVDGPRAAVASSIGQFGLSNTTGSFAADLGGRATLLVDGQVFYDRGPDLSRYYAKEFGGLNGQRSGTFNSIFGPITPAAAPSPEFEVPTAAHSFHATLRAGGLQLTLFGNRSRVSTAFPQNPDNTVYNAVPVEDNRLIVGAGSYVARRGPVTSTSTVMASRHQLDPSSGFQNVYNQFVRGFKYAYGSMWKAEEQVSWTATPKMLLTFGGTYEHFYSIPQVPDLDAPIRPGELSGTLLGTTITEDFFRLRYGNAGGYAQAHYAVTPRVAVTMGGRADYNTRYGATFNPRVGVVAHAGPSTVVKALYGSAFLAPSPWQEYSHFGSFSSSDGGVTYTSDYWHLPNPDLKPQHKHTMEGNVIQAFGSAVSVSASAFYSRITDLVQIYGADQAYAGTYLGWPVAYIDFPVNEGRENTYGGVLGLDVLRSFGASRRIAGRAGLALVNGRTTVRDNEPASPVGGMSPVQLRLGMDVDWDDWSVAPRLTLMGHQRTSALVLDGATPSRPTVPGYTTVDVTVRRLNVLPSVDAFCIVNNVFDRRYVNSNVRAYTNADEFVGVPQDPRRIAVGLELRLR
jgi:outer membrane receptor protein involved in Fe transport